MNFSVDKDVFTKVFLGVSKALPTRSTLPILQNILFEVDENRLSLFATNLDFSIRDSMAIEGGEKASFTLTGKVLQGITSALPSTQMSFELADRTVKVQAGSSKYNLLGLAPEDFPRFREIDGGDKYTFGRDQVLEGVNAVGFCAAKDDPRPFLTGIFWQCLDDEIRFVASDSHKLGLWKKKIPTQGTFEAILPKNVFEFLKARDEESVEVKVGEDILGFFFDHASLLTRLIEGAYAPYEDVVPKEDGNVLTLDQNELQGALRRLLPFTQSPTYLVTWHLAPGEIALFAASPDVGEGRENVSAEYTGQEMQMGFNAQYLLDIVRHIDDEQVNVHFYSPLTAAVIRPAHPKEDEDVLFLLMPIKLE
jgi:DNA polymerase-3 subunit beta